MPTPSPKAAKAAAPASASAEPDTPPAAAASVAEPAPAPAAAPLTAPAEVNTAPAPALVGVLTPIPASADAFLGYVDDQGEPIDPDDLFDLTGTGTIAISKHRSHTAIRRGGSTTVIQSLAYTLGQEVPRAEAVQAVRFGKDPRNFR